MWRRLAIALALAAYVVAGIHTELGLVRIKPIPDGLLEDFGYYERAVADARAGVDPYGIRDIGPAFLYPPHALLVVEPLTRVAPFALKVAVVWAVNVALLTIVIVGIARHYGRPVRDTWLWFPLCFGFAPFLELLHIGQINVVTMFGLFLLFVFEGTAPILAGSGLCLAIATKVSPVLFVGYLVVRRRFRVLAATAVALALLTLITGLRYGPGPLRTYPDVLRGVLGTFPLGANSQSLVAKLSYGNRVLDHVGHLPPAVQEAIAAFETAVGTHPALAHRLLTAYVLVGLVIAGLATLRARQDGEALFVLTTLGMTFTANVMWYHHYVFVLLPVLIWTAWRRLDARIVVWCCAGLFLVQVDRFVPPHGLTVHLWAHVTFLGILACLVRSSLRARPTAVPADG